MYELIDKWSTSLFHCHAESCILAHILPCHIYARLNGSYLCSFIYYSIFWVSLYNVYYWLNHINHNRCPALLTDH